MTTTDGLLPGTAMMWLLSAHFSTENGAAVPFSVQVGRGRQAVLGGADRVGDEPRLLIDFNRGQPLLSVRGERVGERHRDTVRLWKREYHIHRPRFRSRLRYEVAVDECTVLRVRERSRPTSTVRTFVTHSAVELDPIVALGLLLLEGRPDRMGVLNEFLQH
ncbi:MAG: hypothetical protein ACQSGP_16110 [Frankia sp.]